MLFNSYIFILLFLPVSVTGYYVLSGLHDTAGKIWIISGGILFYLYAGSEAAAVFGISILFNLAASFLIQNGRKKDLILGIAIAVNIVLLFHYKYFNFAASNFHAILHKGTEYESRNILLPLGISFFTFQQISWLISCSRKQETKSAGNWILDYLTFILYFPKLIMGPLMEPDDFIGQINDPARKKVNWDHIAAGLKLFCFGLFKKLIIADTFAGGVNWGFHHIEEATAMDWILISFFYTFEIYFDFSGYCDMATGVSAMFNIDLPINFDSPYKALSIRDFWKRWHMTLTGFLTKNVYIPLGGSKKGTARTYVNTMIVFLVSGIWHGANWTFILWGVLHGLLSIWDRVFEKTQKKLPETVRWITTFSAVNILWLLFRSESAAQFVFILKTMVFMWNTSISRGLINCFVLPESTFLQNLFHLPGPAYSIRGFWLLLFTAAAFLLCLVPENNYRTREKNSLLTLFGAIVCFLWAFLCISSESVFVYYNF